MRPRDIIKTTIKKINQEPPHCGQKKIKGFCSSAILSPFLVRCYTSETGIQHKHFCTSSVSCCTYSAAPTQKAWDVLVGALWASGSNK